MNPDRPVCNSENSSLPTCQRAKGLSNVCADWFCFPSESKALAESEREYEQEIVQYAGYPSRVIQAPICVPSVPWTQVAMEGETVNFPTVVNVAYGTSIVNGNPNVLYRYDVTGDVQFIDAYFGGDPDPGQPKLGWSRCFPPFPARTGYVDLTPMTAHHPPTGKIGRATAVGSYGWDFNQSVVNDGVGPGLDFCTVTHYNARIYLSPDVLGHGWGYSRIMRGFNALRTVYSVFNPGPFNTPSNWGDVEHFNLVILNLFRSHFGIGPISLRRDLFLRAQWIQERRRTVYWDTEYPYSTLETGPCVGTPNASVAICGKSFLPFPNHQEEYLKPSESAVLADSNTAVVNLTAPGGEYDGNARFAVDRGFYTFMYAIIYTLEREGLSAIRPLLEWSEFGYSLYRVNTDLPKYFVVVLGGTRTNICP